MGTVLTTEERHRNYIEEEEKRRLGWGIYVRGSNYGAQG